jgi:hypothetical protein
VLVAGVGVQALEFVGVDGAHRLGREHALEEAADPAGAVPAGGDLHQRGAVPGETVVVVTMLEAVSDSVRTRPGSGSSTFIR